MEATKAATATASMRGHSRSLSWTRLSHTTGNSGTHLRSAFPSSVDVTPHRSPVACRGYGASSSHTLGVLKPRGRIVLTLKNGLCGATLGGSGRRRKSWATCGATEQSRTATAGPSLCGGRRDVAVGIGVGVGIESEEAVGGVLGCSLKGGLIRGVIKRSSLFGVGGMSSAVTVRKKVAVNVRRRRMIATCAIMTPNHLDFILGVGVGLPCSVMDCGDVVYRSTLPPPAPFHLTAPGVTLALMLIGYLWATPGVAPGFWDMFVVAPLEAYFRPKVDRPDFQLGKKLGEGAYGSVFKASLSKPKSTVNSLKAKLGGDQLVVKKANEYGAVEIWMNERMRRTCPDSCADFVHGFLDDKKSLSKRERENKKDTFWLVWRYEGESTLADLLGSKDFPYNCEKSLFGKELNHLVKGGGKRENKTVRAIIKQILTALKGLHSTGIVHRDVKPQNLIFAEDTGQFKIIDLGAAADLRVGINYIPKEFLLDPRYAAPEQYIMSTQTPSAPSPPVATALSPVLWQMNKPDRFDLYSVGLIMLQLVFPTLRSDSGLILFNRTLKKAGYDIVAWRELVSKRSAQEFKQGFEILDMDDGAGWDLIQKMVCYKARQRISAGGALAHPYFDTPTGGVLGVSVGKFQGLRLLGDGIGFQSNTGFADWVTGMMARNGTQEVGGFTEGQLTEMVEREKKNVLRKSSLQRNAIASALRVRRRVARTIGQTVTGVDYVKKELWWNRWQQQRQPQRPQQPEPKR